MRAGVYQGPGVIKATEWPVPQLAAGEVLVRVRYAGICGTDLLIHSGRHPRVVPPRVLGHEIFGTVADAQSPADAAWKAGMRVAVYPLISCGRCAPCREGNAHVCEKLGLIGIDTDGGIAEYVKTLPEQIVAVPDAVNDEQAALVEPLSVAVHVVRMSGFRPGDTTLVMGGGPIGNLVAQVLRASGARAAILTEVKAHRRALAEQLHLTAVNPAEENLRAAVQRFTGEPFVDRVFEATGAPAAYRDAVAVCKVRGEIVFVGLPKAPPEVDVLNLVFKEIQTTGARVYTRKDYQAAIGLLERGAVDVTPLITDHMTVGEVAQGFQKMRDAETSLKILFTP
jgi:(R,R)-butanediol dehydrogenase/meso-butanediol dehydrogenase/diacetyl reductase